MSFIIIHMAHTIRQMRIYILISYFVSHGYIYIIYPYRYDNRNIQTKLLILLTEMGLGLEEVKNINIYFICFTLLTSF